MKKAKMILTVVTVLGTVGGALAFKVTYRFNGGVYCGTRANICPVSHYTTANPVMTLYCGTEANVCPTLVGARALL